MQLNKSASFKLVSFLGDSIRHRDEILQNLSLSEANFYFSIYQLRRSGLDIFSYNQIYRISQFQNSLEFSEYERNILAYLLYSCANKLSLHKTKVYSKFLKKALFYGRFYDYDDVLDRFQMFRRIDNNEKYFQKLELIKEAMNDEQKLKITLLSGCDVYLLPLDFHWDKNTDKVFLCYIPFKKGEKEIKEKIVQKVLVEEIAKISIDNEIENEKRGKEIIFQLYGKLVESYLLKTDERIIEGSKQILTIASATKNREELYKRLLRYENLCRIIRPKEAVAEFLNVIRTSLNNIGAAYDKPKEYISNESVFEE